MPKPLLTPPGTRRENENKLDLGQNSRMAQKQQAQQVDKIRLDRMLRRPRSKKYMDAIHKLDSGGHANNRQIVDEIVADIRDEFPEISIDGILLGVISKCYLGAPYEVHTLDLSGGCIIEHYKRGQPLPGGLEKGRSLAMNDCYECIEVYIDGCRAISSNGTVSYVQC